MPAILNSSDCLNALNQSHLEENRKLTSPNALSWRGFRRPPSCGSPGPTQTAPKRGTHKARLPFDLRGPTRRQALASGGPSASLLPLGASGLLGGGLVPGGTTNDNDHPWQWQK